MAHYVLFQQFHLFRLVVFYMIITFEMKHAVNNHVSKMHFQGLVLLGRFSSHDTRTEHHVTKNRDCFFLLHAHGERQHIGRPGFVSEPASVISSSLTIRIVISAGASFNIANI